MKKIIVFAAIVGAGILLVGAVSPLFAHEMHQGRRKGRRVRQADEHERSGAQEQQNAPVEHGPRMCGYHGQGRGTGDNGYRMMRNRRDGCQHWYASFIPWHNCSGNYRRGYRMGC